MPRLFGFPAVPIPGPRALPLVGAPLKFYRFLDDPLGAVLGLREHGDVAAIAGGNPAMVVVFGEARNREVLSDSRSFRHDEDLLRGPPGSAMADLKHGMVCINGEQHKRHRRLMQPAFQNAALDGYAADVLAAGSARLDSWPTGTPARLDTLCRELALCVAVTCFYGIEVGATLPELGQVAAEFMELMTDPGAILAPFDLPGLPHRRSLRLAERLRDGLLALVDEKRRRGATPGEPPRDALAMLVAARDEDGRPLSDPELFADAAGLFIAGHETTAWTLAWTLFLLDQHPAVQAEVRAELDAVLGGRAPGPLDLPRLTRLDAVVKESMRLIPAVPILFFRVCAEDTPLGPFTLPAGANVVVSPFATHHDPALYDEPRRFKPQRWDAAAPGTYAYLPFGAGPRACIGMRFAERSIRSLLAMILQRYRVELEEGSRIDRLVRGNVFMARGGLRARVLPAAAPARQRPTVEGDLLELLDLPAAGSVHP